ncbi:MAG: prolyl oligopeptidase family serine peptidase [Candidatus Omnitrophica bacterium]|nr:prolyl oligopeptidase family serine peptidase [bacterium]MCL4733453.1 prolyl oligopeptidase family serine peptidase [Candidatus Omnitrophota bacterium]
MRNKMDLLLLAGVLLFSMMATDSRGESLVPGQQAVTFEKDIRVTLHYLLYLPPDYGKDPDQKWPLMLFLHGAGERGNDLDKIKKHGPPRLISEGKTFPFIIVSPQCPSDDWWSSDQLFPLLDDVESRYPVDKERVYATGISMGGFGTWTLGMEQPDRFAAIAPICGGGEPILAFRYRHLPIWAFHGAKDDVVPLRRSEEMVEAIQKAGGDAKLTVYPDARHDSWTATYENPELYDWFLQHKRRK